MIQITLPRNMNSGMRTVNGRKGLYGTAHICSDGETCLKGATPLTNG